MQNATPANSGGGSSTASGEGARRAGARSLLADYGPTYGALAALILLVLANAVFTPNFADVNNFRNILLQVAPTVLVAVGMTLVIATGGIDLSVGSVMAIAAALAATNLERGLLPAVLLGLAAALAVGILNGALISGFRIQPIIVTLALLITGRGVAQVISRGGQIILIDNQNFMSLGKGFVGPVPTSVVVMLLVVAVAIFVMRATSFGRYVVAVGGNEAAARLAGVKVHRTKIMVYALSGLLAGMAGLIEAAKAEASDATKVGLYIELDAIAAVVVGGTPLTGGRVTVVGTLIGALIMQVITTSFNMLGIGFAWSLVLKAAIILVAVYIQRPKVA
ncbi:MAG: galactofuranose transport system permease protein [Pyrinomonadaceae bacterium]|nr:galactofuranose transport system permease protein [Pyrinomonadaceae bacterium]